MRFFYAVRPLQTINCPRIAASSETSGSGNSPRHDTAD